MLHRKRLIAFLTIGLLIISSLAYVGYAQEEERRAVETAVGTSFAYQGRLKDNNTPANGDFEFRFSLFDAVSGGSQIGSTLTQVITISDGLFSTELDFGSNVFTGNRRFLAIEVRPNGSGGSFTTLNPRQRLRAVPYAQFAVSTNPDNHAHHSLDSADGSVQDVVFVDNVGKVGIKNTNPQSAFDFVSSGGFSMLRLTNPLTGGNSWEFGIGDTPLSIPGVLSIGYIDTPGGGVGNGEHYSVMSLDPDGNMGIGVLDPTNILTVEQNSATDPVADAWTVYSSQRWKTNVAPIANSVELVEQLRGVTFEWKETGQADIGLIAEEVGEVVPEIVSFSEDGESAESVDYARLVAVLIEATKEQQTTIESLQAQNEALEARLAALEMNAQLPIKVDGGEQQ
ncbi:MAG: tail fiber domain-containing protein [Chloroflexota bacterium]